MGLGVCFFFRGSKQDNKIQRLTRPTLDMQGWNSGCSISDRLFRCLCSLGSEFQYIFGSEFNNKDALSRVKCAINSDFFGLGSKTLFFAFASALILLLLYVTFGLNVAHVIISIREYSLFFNLFVVLHDLHIHLNYARRVRRSSKSRKGTSQVVALKRELVHFLTVTFS